MIRHVFLTLIAVMMATQAWARGENVTSFALNNGMQVVVIEDHRAPIVTHMVWYKAGAADEEAGVSGVAHFLEHLMFKGTENLESGEFSRVIAENGGEENAFTSYDYTGYFQRIAVDRLALMMEMEADRMQGLKLLPEEIEPERGVVLEERKTRTDSDPGAKFGEHRRALFFKNHPYGIPVIGWEHEIVDITKEDLEAFYRKFYAPNNAILIVAGDVYPDDIRALAQKYYGALVPNDAITMRSRPQEPPRLAPIRTSYADENVRQPYVIRGYAAPNRKAGDQKPAAALTFLAELLGGSGVTSVFGQKLQLERKITVAQGAFYDGTSYDPNSFGVYAVPAPGVTLEEAEAALDEVIAEFLETGVDADHLARLKNQLNASEIYSLDDQSGQARRFGEALTSGLTVDDVLAWPDVMQSITAEDIMMAARNLFDINASVTGYLMSKEGADQ